LLWSSDVTSIEDMTVPRESGLYQSDITIPDRVLAPGQYFFTVAIYSPGRSYVFDVQDRAISVEITDGGSLLSSLGIKPHAATMIPLSWKTKKLASVSRSML